MVQARGASPARLRPAPAGHAEATRAAPSGPGGLDHVVSDPANGSSTSTRSCVRGGKDGEGAEIRPWKPVSRRSLRRGPGRGLAGGGGGLGVRTCGTPADLGRSDGWRARLVAGGVRDGAGPWGRGGADRCAAGVRARALTNLESAGAAPLRRARHRPVPRQWHKSELHGVGGVARAAGGAAADQGTAGSKPQPGRGPGAPSWRVQFEIGRWALLRAAMTARRPSAQATGGPGRGQA